MYYRFADGTFVEAKNFEEAKSEKLKRVMAEQEDKKAWHKCTCTGFEHRFSCDYHPRKTGDVPF